MSRILAEVFPKVSKLVQLIRLVQLKRMISHEEGETENYS